jgi:hypothetical protein
VIKEAGKTASFFFWQAFCSSHSDNIRWKKNTPKEKSCRLFATYKLYHNFEP